MEQPYSDPTDLHAGEQVGEAPDLYLSLEGYFSPARNEKLFPMIFLGLRAVTDDSAGPKRSHVEIGRMKRSPSPWSG